MRCTLQWIQLRYQKNQILAFLYRFIYEIQYLWKPNHKQHFWHVGKNPYIIIELAFYFLCKKIPKLDDLKLVQFLWKLNICK